MPEYEEGWLTIMTWRSRMLDNLQPPSRKVLVNAWRSLMESKLRHKQPLNTTQALQCRRLLEYLIDPDLPKQNGGQLRVQDLANARKILLDNEPIEREKEHRELARSIHVAFSSEEVLGKCNAAREWSHLMTILSRFGDARGVLQEVYAKWSDPAYSSYVTGRWDGPNKPQHRVLDAVLQGLASEGAEEELIELVNFALKDGVPYNATIHGTLTTFFATRDRVSETKEWFSKPIEPRPEGLLPTYHAVASFARRNSLQDWALPFFQDLVHAKPSKQRWDALLQSMLLVGIPLSEVHGMMLHMVDPNGPVQPDVETINLLLKVAVETVDRDLAKNIIAIADEMDITPNEYTHLVLLGLHLASGAVSDAAAAFQAFQDEGSLRRDASDSIWGEYTNLMNRYLQTLSAMRPPDFEFILKLLSTIEEDKLHLMPETVASLCLRFLENDQNFDVMDILAVHAFHYSAQQREVVQNAFVAFCLDKNTSTARAWGAYQLLQQFFQDLSLDFRVQLLQAFFDRKRPDMATFVFGHMRQHRNNAYQPTLDTYVQCFEGFARNPDRQGTETVHNMFKMDTRVRSNTQISTALMLAFTACDFPRKAMDLWDAIKNSPEGPSYATLEAAFWMLQKTSSSQKQVRELWEKIEQMDLEVPLSLYNAYVAAVAAGGNEMEIRGLIAKTASIVGTQPDIMT